MRSPRLNVVKKLAISTHASTRPPNSPPVPICDIELDLIDPSTTQPRQYFKDEALIELAASIRLHGVLQPIIARPRGTIADARRCFPRTMHGSPRFAAHGRREADGTRFGRSRLNLL
jgi:hypothetical protein